jgi:PAS domain S-box-containing protein
MMANFFQKPLAFLRSQQTDNSDFIALLNLFPDSAVLLDLKNYSILGCNSRALQMTAYTRAELENTPAQRLFPEVNNIILAAVDKDATTTILSTRQGTAEPIIASLFPLASEHLAVVRFESIAQHHKQERSRLRQSKHMEVLGKLAQAIQVSRPEDIYDAFLEAGSVLSGADSLAIYRVDPAGPRLSKVAHFGLELPLPDSVEAADVGRITGTQLWVQGRRIRTGLQRIARSHDLSYLATAAIGDDNALSGLLVAASHESLPDDHILRILGVLAALLGSIYQQDMLTARLRMINLDQSERLGYHELIHENVSDGIIQVSPAGTILQMNSAAELTLGYSIADVRAARVEDVIIGADNLRPALELALEGIPTPSLGNTALHRRDGVAFPADIQVLPVVIDGAVHSIIIFLRDQSEHHQIKMRTQQLEQRALLGEVTAIFAHEVRNPLNNINMALQLMEMNPESVSANGEWINRMRQDTDRLLHLMESVLSFSRSAERKVEEMDLSFFLERLLTRWQPRMMRVNVRSELHIAKSTPLIKANEQSLEQVFTNLFSNALRAMSETGGTLAVRIYPLNSLGPPRKVMIDVSDTGIGIPPENIDSIFTPFFTTDPQGTGLGLAISQRIITAHRGAMTVESFPGGGTVFHIELPAMPGTGSLEGLLPESAGTGQETVATSSDTSPYPGSA